MPFLPGKVSFWRPLADHRAPDGGVPHAAAPGDEAISTSGMTAKEDKKTLASDGRKAELILALLRGDLALRGVFRHSYNETALRRATIPCIYENVSCAGRH
jgi:hypothetical protein